jgi:hypothetical protein
LLQEIGRTTSLANMGEAIGNVLGAVNSAHAVILTKYMQENSIHKKWFNQIFEQPRQSI